MSEETYAIILSGGNSDGAIISDLIGPIKVPNYVKTALRDGNNRIVFRYERGANLHFPRK